jgi:hypothetical protein
MSGHLLATTVCLALAGLWGADTRAANRNDCDQSLLIRDTLDLSGDADNPAIVTLQRAAGEDIFGVADIAIMGDSLCRTVGDNDLRFGYGVDYHLDTSEEERAESIGAGFALSYAWGADREPSQIGAGQDLGHWRRIAVSAQYGRDIEQNLSIAHIETFFDSMPIGARRTTEKSGDLVEKIGMLGGKIQRRLEGEDGRPIISPPIFFYQFRPGAEYFHGYQPANVTRTSSATYVALAGSAKWQPNAGTDGHPVYLRTEAIFRRKLGGDRTLPDAANHALIALGYEFQRTPSTGFRQKSSIELSYRVGRIAERGFDREESLQLTFTYLMDREDR